MLARRRKDGGNGLMESFGEAWELLVASGKWLVGNWDYSLHGKYFNV